MGLFHTKDRHEFKPLLVEIEDKPLNPLGRSLLWIIMAIIFFGVLWLYLAKVDIVVSARGKVIPTGEIKTLQPIETGVISKLLVKEGEFVHKGQLLVEIDPSVTETNLDSKVKNLELLELEIERIMALIQNTAFHVDKSGVDKDLLATQELIYTTTKKGHEQQLSLIKQKRLQVDQQIESAKVDVNRLQQHSDNIQKKEKELLEVIDIIAKNKYDDVHKQAIEYEEHIHMKKHDIVQLQEKLNELKQQELLTTQDYQNKLLEELTKKRKEATLLKVKIESIKFQKAKQSISSPVDGYVSKLMVHTIGGVVTPAEKLILIVPKNAPLIIKATVLNKDIGFIKEGMMAELKIDTFDFQKYGLIDAIVSHVSNDSIEDKKLGLVYDVYLKPKKNYLIVKGKRAYLSSGMSVTAELKVGQRRVINFFLYPLIKYLDEGMSVR
ncbi:HlyD family type I secretion periplasmic adaptor subunit [Sulfurimonas sp.]|uniref:HlyD family type I secretion periplasmic adaptor subunit n=1 Tax=Sulfurimonas sp. TaxID=2022749 RepID=UPI002611DB1B|nr:HlyD family type I secretion periplasmic adaptor subunit [Sulfurimonas sp.]